MTAGQTIDAADLGDLTYTPPANAGGTGLASFGFKVVDNGGTAYGSANTDTTTNRVTFNVTEVIDIFTGTSANNNLTGTQGVDRLQGLQGNDRLRELGGVDTFVFSTGHDRDTIVDFDAVGAVHDILNIANLRSIASFADLKANHMKQVNSNVLIDGLGGDTITLLNVKLADLDRTDFLI